MNTSDKPFAFTFWENVNNNQTPAYIQLCLDVQKLILEKDFEYVQLDFNNLAQYVPELKITPNDIIPNSQGKTIDIETRKLALFTDYLRIYLIHKFGGLWIDADILPLRHFTLISELVKSKSLVGSESYNLPVPNGIIGAKKNSKFFDQLWQKVEEIKNENRPIVWGELGTYLISNQLEQHTYDSNEIFLFPYELLINNHPERKLDVFSANAIFDVINPLAYCLTLYNNSIPKTYKETTNASLRKHSSVLTQGYDLVTQIDSEQIAKHQIHDATIIYMNRYPLWKELRKEQSRLKEQLNTINQKRKTSNERILKLKERLQKYESSEIIKIVPSQNSVSPNNLDKNPKSENVSTIFTEIFDSRKWGDGQSVSGPGSNMKQTHALRQNLRPTLDSLGVKTLLDCPCGDFNWMKEIDLNGIHYIGCDVVEDIILSNSSKYQTNTIEFEVLDLCSSSLPECDLIFVRDCLVHLSLEDCNKALNNVLNSNIKYLALTTFSDTKTNHDINTGDWRKLNFSKAPFYFPTPLHILDEQHPNPNHSDKSMSIWKISDLKNGKYFSRNA